MDLDPIVEHLAGARKAAGMSIDAVSAASGISKGFLSKAERGLATPSLRVLRRWTAAFGLDVGLVVPAAAQREDG